MSCLSRSVRFTLLCLMAGAVASPLCAQGLTTADEKELAAYRLTMPTLKKVVAAMRTVQQEMAQDPKYQAMLRIDEKVEALQSRLTAIQGEVEKIEAREELTKADEAKLEQLNAEAEKLHEQTAQLAEDKEKAEETIEAGSPMASNPKTLSEMEQNIARVQPLQRALQREGLTAREFSKFMMAMVQAAMVHGFSQGKVDYAKLPAGINPDNVKFIDEHKAELEAMQKEFAALGRKR